LLKGKLRDNKKDIMFLLMWDKDRYTERFLLCVLQPTLVHLYQTSVLLPGPLPIVTSASLFLRMWESWANRRAMPCSLRLFNFLFCSLHPTVALCNILFARQTQASLGVTTPTLAASSSHILLVHRSPL
jgi:hypothetical protein